MKIKVGDIVGHFDYQRGIKVFGKVIRVVNVIESLKEIGENKERYTIERLVDDRGTYYPEEIRFTDIMTVYKEQDLNTFKINKVQINKEQKGSGGVYLEPPTTPRPPAPPNYKVGRKPL